MAAEKTTKRRKTGAKSEPSGGGGGGASMLRLRTDPRKERRYEPASSSGLYISVTGMAIGAVLLGAGVFGQWFRQTQAEPHPYAPWLLLAGALLLAAVGLFGPRSARPLRVGDAGVGSEKDGGEIERIEWRDVRRIVLGGDTLTVQSPGISIDIPVKLHGQGAARVLKEARARVPNTLDDVNDKALPALDDDAGEVIPLDAAQLAGAHCKASDKAIAFEKDVRLCGRCGEVYHKDSVPSKCLTCEAPLR